MRLSRFKCLFCDTCCFFEREEEAPTVYPWEKRVLEELAEKKGFQLVFKPLLVFRDSSGRCAIAIYRWVIEGFCPFFKRGENRCTIHSDKPLACRMYPLNIEMPSGKLMVSGKCEWVRQAGARLVSLLSSKPELIPRVFPQEFEAVREAFVEYRSIIEFAEKHGLKTVSGVEECSEVYDFDDYVARFG